MNADTLRVRLTRVLETIAGSHSSSADMNLTARKFFSFFGDKNKFTVRLFVVELFRHQKYVE